MEGIISQCTIGDKLIISSLTAINIYMNSEEIRHKFLDFFIKRGHLLVPSASLIPKNDPTVLFNTAGMQPLVPYLMGVPHPSGSKRIVNFQKCVRTNDIDEVGDSTHLTFFEMLGNWSLGDYFKEDAINWSYELLTSKEGFMLDPERLYVTVFEGDENAPRDNVAFEVWKNIFKDAGMDFSKRIFFMGVDSNWWSPGDNGPCGPDSEMFYDVTGELTRGLTKEEFLDADKNQQIVEIWNDVFMEYNKKDGNIIGKLKNQNVDTGSGLERITCIVQGKSNVYDTDIFMPVIDKISELSSIDDLRSKRIIADHIRASVFLISDGVTASNTDRGYVLRRLIRRAVRYSDKLGIEKGGLKSLVSMFVEKYKVDYPNIIEKQDLIKTEIEKEEVKFRTTLKRGLKEFEKLSKHNITGSDAFLLSSSYGFPIELTIELAKEKGVKVDKHSFDQKMKEHQDLSRSGAEQKFKGGLADSSAEVTRYHTATHLLQKALKIVLGEEVKQKGSNNTKDRLRFDFNYSSALTDSEIKTVEQLINEKIDEALQVSNVDLEKSKAIATGAYHLESAQYPDIVTIYFIGDSLETAYSKEFCGGPHVKNTKEIGHIEIYKQESVSEGVRRVYVRVV